MSAKVTPRSPSSAQATLSLGLTFSTGLSPSRDEAPAHHRRLADFDARRLALHEVDECACVGAAHIEEKEARRHAWLSLTQFGAHVGVDERERDERGEAEAERQHDGRRQRAGPMDRVKRHAPLDEARTGRAPRKISNAKGDKPERDERHDRRDCDHRRDRLLRAGQDGEREKRDAGERGAGKIALARPALAFLDQVADQRGHGQIVRASERRDREGERGQQSVDQPEAHEAGRDRGRERDRQQGAEQPIDGEGNRRAQRRPEKRADQRHDHELDEREADDARSGRANRLENGERRAFALDETLRRVRDADPADDQRQQSGQREELGEAVEIATEVRVDVETRASVPSGLREGPLRLIHEGLDGGIVGAPCRP